MATRIPFIELNRDKIYLFALYLFVIVLPLANAGISIAVFLLIFSWLISGSFRDKWKKLISLRFPLIFCCIPLVYLMGSLYTDHPEIALKEIIRSLYWIAFPVVISTSRPLHPKEAHRLINLFLFSVTLAALVIAVKLTWPENFHLQNFREASLIDHIPYSYQLAFAIFLLIDKIFIQKLTDVSIGKKILWVAWVLMLTTILLILKSFTGYFFFAGAALAGLLFVILYYPRYRAIVMVILLMLVMAPSVYIYRCIHFFYQVPKFTPENIEWKTHYGKPYHHDFQDKLKENGQYVNLFICHEELREAWNQRSAIPYDSVWNGQDSIKWVIHRYMTSLGLRKDRDGIHQLTEQDIRNIEKGLGNHIYQNYRLGIYPRIYETIWEIDGYLQTGDPNRKSFAQRIEMYRVSWAAIKKSPMIGYGTGDAATALVEQARLQGSRMDPGEFRSPHNQYLGYLIKFGLLGTFFIFAALWLPFIYWKAYRTFPIFVLFAGLWFANFGEGNLESFIGINFFGIFYCLYLWAMPDRFNH